jgi:hypothetical protein
MFNQSLVPQTSEEYEEQFNRALLESLRDEEMVDISNQLVSSVETARGSGEEELAAAMELSFVEAHQSQQMNYSKTDSIHISNVSLFYTLVNLKPDLEAQYGVNLRLEKENSDHYIVISSSDELVTTVAKHSLLELINNPVQLRKEQDHQRHEEQQIHIFIDQSNIFISCQSVPARDGKSKMIRDATIRIDCEQLDRMLSANRGIREKVVFGSKNSTIERDESCIPKLWEKLGYKVAYSHRPSKTGESFVDDALIAQIQQPLLMFPSPPHPVHTLVLLTGDGNDNEGRASFYSTVQQALMQGWKVELWAWRYSVSKKYFDYQSSYADTNRFRIIFLDDYRDLITYKWTGKGQNKAKHIDPHFQKHHRNNGVTVSAEIDAHHGSVQSAHSRSNPRKPFIAPRVKEKMNNSFFEEDEEADDPEWMNCPLTYCILSDPVTTIYGNVYERRAITDWINRCHKCPMTGKPLNLNNIREVNPLFLDRLRKFRDTAGYK